MFRKKKKPELFEAFRKKLTEPEVGDSENITSPSPIGKRLESASRKLPFRRAVIVDKPGVLLEMNRNLQVLIGLIIIILVIAIYSIGVVSSRYWRRTDTVKDGPASIKATVDRPLTDEGPENSTSPSLSGPFSTVQMIDLGKNPKTATNLRDELSKKYNREDFFVRQLRSPNGRLSYVLFVGQFSRRDDPELKALLKKVKNEWKYGNDTFSDAFVNTLTKP